MPVQVFPVSKVDTKDLRMVRWILERLDDISETDYSGYEELAAGLFDDAVVGELLQHSDEEMLAGLFRCLAAQCFSGKLDVIVERWPLWTGALAKSSTPIIAELDPERAFGLFLSFFSSKGKRPGAIEKLC